MGLLFIGLSLFFDGLLSDLQNRFKQKNKVNGWQLMELMNTYASLAAIAFSMVSLELFHLIKYLQEYPDVINQLLLMGLLGAMGQSFIFYTIANFSPLILSIITSCRKFMTVIASILYYSHPVNDNQKYAIALVFGGIAVEMFLGKKKKTESKEEAKELAKPEAVDSPAKSNVAKPDEAARADDSTPKKVKRE